MSTQTLPTKCAVFCASLLLAACGGSGGGSDHGTDGGDDTGGGLAGIGKLSFEAGCDWRETFRDGQQYLSLADTAARYWYAVAPSEPTGGTRLRIDGRYADARYFSLHVYDGYLLAHDARADYRLVPDSGSFNPFLDKTRRSLLIPSGGAWSAALAFTDRPVQAEANTLYRGDRGNQTDPLQRQTFLVYRAYLPTDAQPALPALTLERADGSTLALADTPEASRCEELDALFSDFQHATSEDFDPGTPPTPQDPPRFEIYYPLSDELPPLVYNLHIRYMSALIDDTLGELVLMRARAPSYPGAVSGLTAPQVRFWSVCANRFEDQFVDGCTYDALAPLDAEGFFNLVISPEVSRPANATPAQGYAWLPLHGDPERLIYRMMLAADSFEQSIDQVDQDEDPATVMGAYHPQITYCARAVFESAQGLSPAATFAVCAASDH